MGLDGTRVRFLSWWTKRIGFGDSGWVGFRIGFLNGFLWVRFVILSGIEGVVLRVVFILDNCNRRIPLEIDEFCKNFGIKLFQEVPIWCMCRYGLIAN